MVFGHNKMNDGGWNGAHGTKKIFLWFTVLANQFLFHVKINRKLETNMVSFQIRILFLFKNYVHSFKKQNEYILRI